jgi:hypothetical protein
MAARAMAREIAAIGGALELHFPFNQDLVDELKLAVPVRHRHWDKEERVWRVAGAFAQAAVDALLEHHPRAEVPAAYARPKTRVMRPVSAPQTPLVAAEAVVAQIPCPACSATYPITIRLTAQTSRQAADRPVTPEFAVVCPACRALAVIAFIPASASRSAL